MHDLQRGQGQVPESLRTAAGLRPARWGCTLPAHLPGALPASASHARGLAEALSLGPMELAWGLQGIGSMYNLHVFLGDLDCGMGGMGGSRVPPLLH